MSSVRVNLLPQATRAKGRANQRRLVASGAMVALVLLLAGIWLWSGAQVRSAEERLVAERARTTELRAEEGRLVAFRTLDERRASLDEALRAAMSGEVSFAGVLQDLAAVMPSDTQLETLAVQLGAPDTATSHVGTFNLTGRTLTSHAPGVERVLLQLEKIVTFRGLYLNSSTLDDPDARIAAFSLDGQVGSEASTGRYADGLPVEMLR